MSVFGTLGLNFSLLIRPDSACFWLAEKSLSALWSAQYAFHASHTHGACQQLCREGVLTHTTGEEAQVMFLVYPPSQSLLGTAALGSGSDQLSTPKLLTP